MGHSIEKSWHKNFENQKLQDKFHNNNLFKMMKYFTYAVLAFAILYTANSAPFDAEDVEEGVEDLKESAKETYEKGKEHVTALTDGLGLSGDICLTNSNCPFGQHCSDQSTCVLDAWVYIIIVLIVIVIGIAIAVAVLKGLCKCFGCRD